MSWPHHMSVPAVRISSTVHEDSRPRSTGVEVEAHGQPSFGLGLCQDPSCPFKNSFCSALVLRLHDEVPCLWELLRQFLYVVEVLFQSRCSCHLLLGIGWRSHVVPQHEQDGTVDPPTSCPSLEAWWSRHLCCFEGTIRLKTMAFSFICFWTLLP